MKETRCSGPKVHRKLENGVHGAQLETRQKEQGTCRGCQSKASHRRSGHPLLSPFVFPSWQEHAAAKAVDARRMEGTARAAFWMMARPSFSSSSPTRQPMPPRTATPSARRAYESLPSARLHRTTHNSWRAAAWHQCPAGLKSAARRWPQAVRFAYCPVRTVSKALRFNTKPELPFGKFWFKK